MEVIDQIVSFVGIWFPVVTSVIGTAAVIATKTPNKSDDKIIQTIWDVVNFFGANFGQAKNDPEQD